MVALERQDVIAAPFDNPPGDLALAIERIRRHDRAVQRQQFQKLQYRGGLTCLGVGGDLSEHQALFTAPRADHMKRRASPVGARRPPDGFSVDGDYPTAGLAKPRHEFLKAGAKLLRVELAKQPAERVVAGNS